MSGKAEGAGGMDEGGFTLLEVLAALLILSLSLTGIYALFSQSFGLSRAARERVEMSLRATYELHALDVLEDLRLDRDERRVEDGLCIQRRVGAYAQTEGAVARAGGRPVRLREISVSVGPADCRDPVAVLHTLRLVVEPGP